MPEYATLPELSNPAETKTAPLIDGFPSTQCHIDRITIVGDLSKPLRFLNRWQNNIDVNEMKIAKFPYRHQWNSSCNYILQQKDRDADVPELRIEFNPNTLVPSTSFYQIISNLLYPRITRLDFAVDYERDLSSYRFHTKIPKKSTSFFSRSGKLETHYIGSRNSGNLYRIYDKAKEQKEDGIKWRIEQEIHFRPDQNWETSEPFFDLEAYEPALDEKLMLSEQAMLCLIQHHPEKLGQLHARTRAKYKDLLKSGSGSHRLNPHPWDVYHHAKPRLRKMINAFLNPNQITEGALT
jgi:hypothetical protein